MAPATHASPVKKLSALKKVLEPKKTAKSEKQQNNTEGEDTTMVQAKPQPQLQQPIFQTFTSKLKLREGLSIVRDLGGGKYEIVNLSTIDRDTFTSEEAGRSIKSVPERLALLKKVNRDWSAIKLKSKLAQKSAEVKLFRFKKLPIELRMKIYDFTLLSPSGNLKLKAPGDTEENLAIGLLRTCHQVYKEARPFIYQNNFNLSLSDICDRLKPTSATQFIKNVTFNSLGYLKDRNAFHILGKWPKLEVLKLDFYSFSTPYQASNRVQRLYQNENDAARFNQANGFDKLVAIRGLRKVEVKASGLGMPTKAETKVFQAFLMRILTQPRA